MKQKPDETLDQWVRQTLSQLPDTPPVGSSFDSEQLWDQLRPELQPAPSPRKRGLIWWLAVACLAGLTLGWLWQHQTPDAPTKMAGHIHVNKADMPKVSRSSPNFADHVATRKSVFSEKEYRPLSLRTRTRQKEKLNVESRAQPVTSIDVVVQTPELPMATDAPLIMEKRPEHSKPNTATITPKRQFQVVHENELRAQEDTRLKLYRSEHFVRLGIEHTEEPVQDQSPPTLIMPLTNKPNL